MGAILLKEADWKASEEYFSNIILNIFGYIIAQVKKASCGVDLLREADWEYCGKCWIGNIALNIVGVLLRSQIGNGSSERS